MVKKVLSISNLSRLSIPDEAQDGLENDLEGILSYIQKLDEVDVEGIEPFYHPHDLTLRLRDRTEQVADLNPQLQPAIPSDWYAFPNIE